MEDQDKYHMLESNIEHRIINITQNEILMADLIASWTY